MRPWPGRVSPPISPHGSAGFFAVFGQPRSHTFLAKPRVQEFGGLGLSIAPSPPPRSLAGYSPDTPASSSDRRSEELAGVSGEYPARLWGGSSRHRRGQKAAAAQAGDELAADDSIASRVTPSILFASFTLRSATARWSENSQRIRLTTVCLSRALSSSSLTPAFPGTRHSTFGARSSSLWPTLNRARNA